MAKHLKDSPGETTKKAANAARTIKQIRAKKRSGKAGNKAAALISAIRDPKAFAKQMIISGISSFLPQFLIIAVIVLLPLALFSFLFDWGSDPAKDQKSYEEVYQDMRSDINAIFNEKFIDTLGTALELAEERRLFIIDKYQLDEFNPTFECETSAYEVQFNVSLILSMYSWSYQAGDETGFLVSGPTDQTPDDVEMKFDIEGDSDKLLEIVKDNADDLWLIHIMPSESEDLSSYVQYRVVKETDEEGNPVPYRDRNGNPIRDAEGAIIYKTKTIKVMEGVTISYAVTMKPTVNEIFRDHFGLNDEEYEVAKKQAENLSMLMDEVAGMQPASGAVADVIRNDAPNAEDRPLDYMLIGPAQHWAENTTDEYGNRMLNGEPDFHTGLDIGRGQGASRDTNVVASGNGRVVDIETTYSAAPDNSKASYGNYVLAYYGRKQTTVDGHFMWVKVYALTAHHRSVSVAVGDSIAMGQEMGEIGESGNAYGEHIHFEIYYYEEATSALYTVNPRVEIG